MTTPTMEISRLGRNKLALKGQEIVGRGETAVHPSPVIVGIAALGTGDRSGQGRSLLLVRMV